MGPSVVFIILALVYTAVPQALPNEDILSEDGGGPVIREPSGIPGDEVNNGNPAPPELSVVTTESSTTTSVETTVANTESTSVSTASTDTESTSTSTTAPLTESSTQTNAETESTTSSQPAAPSELAPVNAVNGIPLRLADTSGLSPFENPSAGSSAPPEDTTVNVSTDTSTIGTTLGHIDVTNATDPASAAGVSPAEKKRQKWPLSELLAKAPGAQLENTSNPPTENGTGPELAPTIASEALTASSTLAPSVPGLQSQGPMQAPSAPELQSQGTLAPSVPGLQSQGALASSAPGLQSQGQGPTQVPSALGPANSPETSSTTGQNSQSTASPATVPNPNPQSTASLALVPNPNPQSTASLALVPNPNPQSTASLALVPNPNPQSTSGPTTGPKLEPTSTAAPPQRSESTPAKLESESTPSPPQTPPGLNLESNPSAPVRPDVEPQPTTPPAPASPSEPISVPPLRPEQPQTIPVPQTVPTPAAPPKSDLEPPVKSVPSGVTPFELSTSPRPTTAESESKPVPTPVRSVRVTVIGYTGKAVRTFNLTADQALYHVRIFWLEPENWRDRGFKPPNRLYDLFCWLSNDGSWVRDLLRQNFSATIFSHSQWFAFREVEENKKSNYTVDCGLRAVNSASNSGQWSFSLPIVISDSPVFLRGFDNINVRGWSSEDVTHLVKTSTSTASRRRDIPLKGAGLGKGPAVSANRRC